MLRRIIANCGQLGRLQSTIRPKLAAPIYTQTHQQAPSASSRAMINISQDKWSSVPLGPPDAILGITEAYKQDQSPQKINLGVGAYRDEQGRPYVLESVKRAEGMIPERYPEKEYAGIAGLPEFCKLSARLAFGSESPLLAEQRVPAHFNHCSSS